MTRKLVVIAALGALATAGAHAFQGEQYPIPPTPFESSQSRAQVQAQAQAAPVYTNGGTGVHAPTQGTDRAEVKAQALTATRNGQAEYGEM